MVYKDDALARSATLRNAAVTPYLRSVQVQTAFEHEDDRV